MLEKFTKIIPLYKEAIQQTDPDLIIDNFLDYLVNLKWCREQIKSLKDPEQAAILQMLYIGGEDIGDIATSLNVSVEEVTKQEKRAFIELERREYLRS